MNTKANEMVDKYVYAVSKRLPAKQRDDIEKEIRTLIDDMLIDMFPEGDKQLNNIEKVLKELGNPKALAAKYKISNQYLIGPDYFDTYFYVLKIVLAAVAVGMLIATIIRFFVDTPSNIFIGFADGFSGIFSALLGVFAWITIIFALINRYADDKLGIELRSEFSESDWSLKNLPTPPSKKSIIHRYEPIIAIVFYIIFFILFNYTPQMIGIISITNDTTRIVPILNLENISSFVLIVNIVIGIGLLNEILRLLEGKYTLRLSIGYLILSSTGLILTIIAITNSAFWNQNFLFELTQAFKIDSLTQIDIEQAISIIFKGIIALTVVIFVIENVTNFYKAIRYNK